MGKFDDWVMKTYKAKKKFRVAGTSIVFTPFYSTDDPQLQDKIESHPWFRTGIIFEVKKEQEADLTDAVVAANKDPREELKDLSRRDLQTLAKRLEINAGGSNIDIIGRICETSPDPATGTA